MDEVTLCEKEPNVGGMGGLGRAGWCVWRREAESKKCETKPICGTAGLTITCARKEIYARKGTRGLLRKRSQLEESSQLSVVGCRQDWESYWEPGTENCQPWPRRTKPNGSMRTVWQGVPNKANADVNAVWTNGYEGIAGWAGWAWRRDRGGFCLPGGGGDRVCSEVYGDQD